MANYNSEFERIIHDPENKEFIDSRLQRIIERSIRSPVNEEWVMRNKRQGPQITLEPG